MVSKEGAEAQCQLLLLWNILSLEEDAEAFIHRGLVLCSVGLAFLQGLDGAELSCEPLKQGLLHMERLKHPLVDRPQLPVNLDLRKHLTDDIFCYNILMRAWSQLPEAQSQQNQKARGGQAILQFWMLQQLSDKFFTNVQPHSAEDLNNQLLGKSGAWCSCRCYWSNIKWEGVTLSDHMTLKFPSSVLLDYTPINNKTKCIFNIFHVNIEQIVLHLLQYICVCFWHSTIFQFSFLTLGTSIFWNASLNPFLSLLMSPSLCFTSSLLSFADVKWLCGLCLILL